MPAFAIQAFGVVTFPTATSCLSMKDASHNKRPVGIIIPEIYKHLVANFRNAKKSAVLRTIFAGACVGCHHPKPVCLQAVGLLPEHSHFHPSHILRILVVSYGCN